MYLTVVRHGETSYNKQHLIQGWIDLPLNETGKNQALEAANNLLNEHFDVIISSPLKRARQTTEIILNKLNIKTPYSIDSRFIERNFGIYENRTVDPYINILNKQNFDVQTVENNESIFSRVTEGIFELNKLYPDSSVLLVCHAHVLKTIMLLIDSSLGYDYLLKNGAHKKFYVAPNNSLTLL